MELALSTGRYEKRLGTCQCLLLNRISSLMLLEWESDTKSLPGLEIKLGVGNPRAPHPLYETMHVCMECNVLAKDTHSDIILCFIAL